MMNSNNFLKLYEMKIINKNSLIKCKYYDKIFGDVYGIITDIFVIDNIKVNNNEIFIECFRNTFNNRYLMKPENIIEIDGMSVSRLENLFLKRRNNL